MNKIILILASLMIILSGYGQKNLVSENEHQTMAVLWFQKSAEKKALYLQAYNIAKWRLDQKLQDINPDKKYAVICDIDETLLDNSPFQGKCILDEYSFSDSLWFTWTSLEAAKALPGALEFTQYASSKGVKIFYVSNRDVKELKATMNNMKNLGFPNIEEAYFLLRTHTSDKEERRNKVADKYEIILLCGDNLGDFTNVFDNRKENYGLNHVDHFKEEFGNRFIVFPNPMYGTWEKAIYKGSYAISSGQKNTLRKEALESY